VEFRILGPLEAVHEGHSIPLGAAKQRALLAILLIHANQVVSVDRLIDDLWGDEPPDTSAHVVQVYVSQLRKVLERAGDSGQRLATRRPGYVLNVVPDELDLLQFERLVEEGTTLLPEDPPLAAKLLRQALVVWRGPALADFAFESFALHEVERLEEMRLAALESRIGADLASGRHAELIGELDALVSQHPFRERLQEHRMLALYRSGRQAEALQAYQQARQILVEELGIDPRPALQRLERGILEQDPSLEWTAPPKAPSAAPPVPAESPPAPAEAAARPLQPTDAPPAPVARGLRKTVTVASFGVNPEMMPGMELDPETIRRSESEHAEPIEERRIVTVLVCGSTVGPFAAELDPEDLRASLQPFQDSVRRHVERYGGSVERVSEGAVVAVFGAPTAHEDDAERAIRAGFAVLSELRDRVDQGAPAPAAIGIATGTALVTIGDGREQDQLTVVGGVLPMAARLHEASSAGAIVVDDPTYRLTERTFEFEPLDPVAVRGRPEPVPVFRATAARARLSADLIEGLTPLVGRELERNLLFGAFERSVKAKTVHLLTVVGEPGVGKSRLVAELFSLIDMRPELIRWRQGRCLPYGDGVTFWALGEIVKAEAGILESDSPEVAAAKLDAVVSEGDADAPWLRQRLRPLVGLEAPQASREENFAAWRRFLESLAETDPAVFVFEDLHWADDALLAFLAHVADYAEGVPMLLVATARPEFYERAPTWAASARNATRVDLAPLSQAETADLISNLLEEPVLPAEVQQAILSRSGGNPLYAEEFIRLLKDRGVLTKEGPTWMIESDAEIPMPLGVQALIAARLDTLTPERKRMLFDAAVLGKVFWSGAVAAMAERDIGGVDQGFHELSRKELVRQARRSSMEGETEYAFFHDLIRDVCYGQIPRAARAAKHRAAAVWIESVAGKRLEDHAELLAHHYTTALDLTSATGGVPEGAVVDAARRVLTMAGQRGVDLDPARGRIYIERALELTPAGHPERGRMLVVAQRAAFRRGKMADAEKFARQAIEEFRASGNEVAVGDRLVSLASILPDRGDNVGAMDAFDQGIAMLERHPPGPELACAYAERAWYLALSGDTAKAIDFAERALAMSGDDGDLTVMNWSLTARGIAGMTMGRLEGIEDFRRIIELSSQAEDSNGLALGYTNLAEALWVTESPQSGLNAYEKARKLAQRRGQLRTEVGVRIQSLKPLFDLGRWDELVQIVHEEQGWLSEFEYWSVFAEPLQAEVLAYRGGIAEAAALVAGFLPKARAIADLQILPKALVVGAMVEKVAGRIDGAVALVAELVAELEAISMKAAGWYLLNLVPDVARICSAAGHLVLAEGLLDRLSPVFARHQCAALAGQAILLEARGDLPSALARYERVAEDWAGYGHILERGQALLGHGRCLLALDRPEAGAVLRDARGLFVALGATPLVDETDRYLGRATALSS